jgi:hypothetical protein
MPGRRAYRRPSRSSAIELNESVADESVGLL